MTDAFIFEPTQPELAQPGSRDEKSQSLSRFNADQWRAIREQASLSWDQGEPVSIVEIHSINGGAVLQLVSHQKPPGSRAVCLWTDWSEALLVERPLKNRNLPSLSRRPPASPWLQGYVMVANPMQASYAPIPYNFEGQYVELASYEREFWLVSGVKAKSDEAYSDNYLGYWTPVTESDLLVLKHADDNHGLFIGNSLMQESHEITQPLAQLTPG